MNNAILLKTCEKKENYHLVMRYVKKDITNKETYSLLEALGEFFNQHQEIDVINFEDFSFWFSNVYMPDIKTQQLKKYQELFDNIASANPIIIKDLIDTLIKKDFLASLEDAIVKNESIEYFQNLVNSLEKPASSEAEVSMDILEDTETTDRSRGLRWRLESLNAGAGPLLKGDFVLMAGRFNSGKSSFAISELSYMAEQLSINQDVLLFVNEGRAVDYKERIYQAIFDAPIEEIKGNREKYKKLYTEIMGRPDKIKLFSIPRFTNKQVEGVIKRNNPGLIVIDMIDHIGGFKINSNEPSDQKMRILYRWVGDVAIKYAPLIGTTQVSYAQGDDPKWPKPEKLTGSTTAKQEAPNLIITIGREEDLNSTTRYIASTKNKFKAQDEYFKFTCKFDKHNVRFI